MSNLRFSEPDSITLRVITQRFFEDSIHDGDVEYHFTETEEVEVTVGEAIDLIRGLGLEFKASGSGWAADPDGSTIIDYRTGEREEVSVHFADPGNLDGYIEDAIVTAVDAPFSRSYSPNYARNHSFLH